MTSKQSSGDISIKSFDNEPRTVVASFFNGLNIPKESDFHLYKHNKRQEYEMHGENNRLQYDATTDNSENNDKYCLAQYDPVTKTLQLHETPVLTGKVLAKSKRVSKGPKVNQLGVRNAVQRTALGEAFGTKKAKSAINNLERNKIDAEKLQDMQVDIVDSVKESTQHLPSRAEMDQNGVDERPMPKANVEATSVEDIYPLENIIPPEDWDCIRITTIMEQPEQERKELLPYTQSHYIGEKISNVNNDSDKAKLLYYLSVLLAVYHHRRVRDKDTLMEKFNNLPPETLINTVLKQFTVNKATNFGKSKDRSFFIDPHHEDKLVCYILAIIFHLETFLVQIQPISHELNIKPMKVANLCRIMGAIVKPATVSQAEALSIPKALVGSSKLASLKVPFKLPDMTKRVRR